MENILELVKKQEAKIEALTKYLQYTVEHTKPTIEKFVEMTDDDTADILIQVWEQENSPCKWELL